MFFLIKTSTFLICIAVIISEKIEIELRNAVKLTK